MASTKSWDSTKGQRVSGACDASLFVLDWTEAQRIDVTIAIAEEVEGEGVGACFSVGSLFKAVWPEFVDDPFAQAEEDWGVSGDEELGVLVDQLLEARKQRELADDGKGGLGLVHEVETVGTEGRHGIQESFAMGAFVEVAKPRTANLLGVSEDVIEGLGSKEQRIAGPRGLGKLDLIVKWGMRVASREVVVLGSTLRREAVIDGDGLEEG